MQLALAQIEMESFFMKTVCFCCTKKATTEAIFGAYKKYRCIKNLEWKVGVGF